jgi:hypothetical protein
MNAKGRYNLAVSNIVSGFSSNLAVHREIVDRIVIIPLAEIARYSLLLFQGELRSGSRMQKGVMQQT